VTETESILEKATRRRAVRAAGPANGGPAETTTLKIDKAIEEDTVPRKPDRRRRRPSNRRLVAIVAASVVGFATLATGGAVGWLLWDKNQQDQAQAHDRMYVDTAVQTLVNMYTFKPDNVEQSVDNFYSGISGALRDEWARDNHIDNLKQFLLRMGNSSEVVVKGATLENVDPETKTASVLVAIRVTGSDTNGNNMPSKPLRWRLQVSEDLDSGKMTVTDMKYPDGGN
jgi:Mce-associated membrane protein